MRDPKWAGITRHGAGWRATVWVGKHRKPSLRAFPLDTSVAVMQTWRADEKARRRRTRQNAAGTFGADAARYLKAVIALPTFKEREREIALWVTEFGERRRDSLTPADIRAVRDRWLTEPRGTKDGEPLQPLSPATVNKRLRALSNLYRVLDGRRADNPVRDVDEAREPDPIPRAYDYATIERVIAAMGDYVGGQFTKNPRPADHAAPAAVSKVRAKILAYTGISPSTLKRITKVDVDAARCLVTLPARRKGRGVAAAVVPLLPPAVEAFAELDRLDGWGPFNVSALRRTFGRAAKKAGVTGIQVKDLRHSLATVAYDLTGSLEVVMAMLQHTSKATTRRYTLAAALRVLQAQAQPLVEHFGRRTGRRADQNPSEMGRK